MTRLKQRYERPINVDGKNVFLGRWPTERAAHEARDQAILHFKLSNGLAFPEKARKLGPASPEELRARASRAVRESLFTSPFFGVSWSAEKGRWFARVNTAPGHGVGIGLYTTEEEAAVARDRVLLHIGVSGALLNFPERRLKPLSLAAAKAEIRQRRKTTTTSQYIGVTQTRSGNWRAWVNADKRTVGLGNWRTEKEAALVRDSAALHYLGADTRLNFPRRRRSLTPRSAEEINDIAQRQARESCSSRYLGVSRKGEFYLAWDAYLMRGERRLSLGAWAEEKDAAIARDRAALFYEGPEATLNFARKSKSLGPADAKTLRTEARWRYKETTTSRFQGVHVVNDAWVAGISHGGQYIRLGTFSDEVDAATAYDRAALRLRGKGAKLNIHPDTGAELRGQVPSVANAKAPTSRGAAC